MRAIKDWCANPQLHERQIRVLQSRARPVNVLTTHSSWLLSSLVLGCNGLLSGSGSVIADLQAQLFRAVQGRTIWMKQRSCTTASRPPPRCSTPSRGSTCTTA